MIMNKKAYEVEKQEQPEEIEPDYVHNIECEKLRIYNNARFSETIRKSPDAMKIIGDMIYFASETEDMIHFTNMTNNVRSLYVQRNILIESFGRFISSRLYDFIVKIFNEAINRGKSEKDKKFCEYTMPKELLCMLANLSTSAQFLDGFNINAELFAETVRIDMINFYLIQNDDCVAIQADEMFNDITKNLLYNVIVFHNAVTMNFLDMMNNTSVSEAQSRMVCEPCQTFISQPYYSEINRNLRNYNTEPLFKFSKMINEVDHNKISF